MHPQIRRPIPGNCPICGMALEPEMPSLDDERNPELDDFTERFRWTLPLTIVGVAIAMGGHRFVPLSPGAMSWLEMALAAPASRSEVFRIRARDRARDGKRAHRWRERGRVPNAHPRDVRMSAPERCLLLCCPQDARCDRSLHNLLATDRRRRSGWFRHDWRLARLVSIR
jgi:hypothetical protein